MDGLASLPHLIIADDEPANRALLTALLVPEGYAVTTVEDGLACLDALATRPASLVLLDVLMPRMDGVEACRRIRAQYPGVPVLMVTALTDRASRLTALDAGADDLLTKPIDEVELLGRVRNLVRLHQLRDNAERARVEAQSDEKLRRVYAALGCGVLVFDRDGVIVNGNDASAELFGTAREKLSGAQVRDFVTPLRADGSPLPVEERALSKVLRDRVAQRGLLVPALRHDGRKLWIQLDAVPVLRHDGEVEWIVVTLVDITARHLAEQAVRDSERMLRAAERLAHVGSFDEDLVTGKTWWSDEMFRICRVDPASFRGSLRELFDSRLHPDDREAVTAAIGETVAMGSDSVGVLRMLQPEGGITHLSIVSEIVRDTEGRPVRIQGAAQDVTDRRQAELAHAFLSTDVALEKGEAFFSAVALELTRLLDLEIAFVGVRTGPAQSALRTLGLAMDGRVRPSMDFPIARTPCELVLAAGEAVFPRGVDRQFPECSVSIGLGAVATAGVALAGPEGAPQGILGVMSRRPIESPERVMALLRLFATRVGAEMTRQRAESRVNDLFRYAPDAILMVDGRGIVKMANRESGVVFGEAPERLVGLHIERLIPARAAGEGESAFPRSAVEVAGAPRRERRMAKRHDGRPFPAEVQARAVDSDEGVLALTSVRDLTDLVRAESERETLEGQLLHAQKMEAVGTLAGGIAHDFNNILQAIFMNVKLALADLEPRHPATTSLDDIAIAADRGRSLVHQILTFSRKERSARSVVSLRSLIEEAGALLRATLPAGVELSLDLESPGPYVLADATQLHQVLMNLGTNAWHALQGRSGRVRIVQDTVAAQEGSGETSGKVARLSVIDTGVGIDPSILPRVFEPFFTTKAAGRGSGLGLAVVHGIVERHGGSISVESTLGVGTTFRVLLPISAAQPIAPTPARPAPRATGLTLMLIDDEDLILKSTARLLKRMGFEVSTFHDPVEAMAALAAERATHFDVVLTDSNMPRMSGIDVARAVRSLRRDLPVVLMSGFFDTPLAGEAADAGIRELVGKPFSIDTLGEALLRAVRGGP